MENKIINLIDKLSTEHSLSLSEYEELINGYTKENADYAAKKAKIARKAIYGNDVYVRGLIEISNFCKNDCFYCGIRKSNKKCQRYRLEKEDILQCAKTGYELGFRTFVLQGGEDMYYSDDVLCNIVKSIKQNYPDCAVTLSLGERERKSYEKLFLSGADRYLLRHETADSEHYGKLHPSNLSLANRMNCLKILKETGFQTGCGFMVGSPFQTSKTLAEDLKFIEEFSPEMCGIGPFIPHKDTPFKDCLPGSCEMTLYLLSVIRIIKPNILLPATTALGTINKMGREMGILAGANVIMPNLSPSNVREKYELYNGKLHTGNEAAEQIANLKKSMEKIGYNVVSARGDIKYQKRGKTNGSI